MNISIVGTGYVGLVTGACFAELGNKVICIDNDKSKINSLKKGILPFYEPGLEELVRKNMKLKNIIFNSDIKSGIEDSLIVFIAVGTPSRVNGEADLTGIESVARSIAQHIKGYKLIVEKSTVPVETGMWVERTIQVNIKGKAKFDVASNPEFLREGSAISDFMHPDRIVIGVESSKARDILLDLYKPLNAPILITDIKSAELIKHASNSFLAAKISFINAVSQVCERTGADVTKVAEGMGLDKRIGAQFLDAGVGYGGSCFPKDVDAFISISDKLGYNFELLKCVSKINTQQRNLVLNKVRDALWIVKGKTIGILGLSFKPNTDDMRSSPAIDIIKELQQEGAKIKAYDPVAMKKAAGLLKNVKFANDIYKLAEGCDCLVIVTDWNEFKEIDFAEIKKLLKRPLIIDGRNIYDKNKLKKMGFEYISIGRR